MKKGFRFQVSGFREQGPGTKGMRDYGNIGFIAGV
jgi:hypothetical protein